ncbi:M20 family metallo-hydrolase [Vibrio sp. SCSIO 43137]|uniref:M20 family metallo-hydrolase n=1 Tax=Vibrio sp. SCSIO 43137 TaxID=3021011 RepID=UPI002307F6D2|nr:M20 family metallo-hydrolase [Vibrio sp. SCSIO 43137]WCE28894.1 M20 family metallo-hydrolase [Vibrio sp. SCSIO 43137]
MSQLPEINMERVEMHLEHLRRFSATYGEGVTRLTYTSEYRQACDYFISQCRHLGLEIRTDAIGNIFATWHGRHPEQKKILVGSHLDTVVNGGHLDGILGVVAGLEVVQTMQESNIEIDNSIEIACFAEEEGINFRCPLAGSKLIMGEVESQSLLALTDRDGRSYADVLQEYGLNPMDLDKARLDASQYKAMVELHIEQGVVLEQENTNIGVVSCIAGSYNCDMTFDGISNHAGAIPMPLRFDALAGAAEYIQKVEAYAKQSSSETLVSTVGRITCIPNAANVIPRKVTLALDIRDIENPVLDTAEQQLKQCLYEVGDSRKLGVSYSIKSYSRPIQLDKDVVELVRSHTENRGYSYKMMHSGALHDAAIFAGQIPTAMIFVPSIGGRSHVPEEETKREDIEKGVNILLDTVISLSQG